jgi:hypothetical protein
MELHRVRLAAQPQAEIAQRKPAGDPQIAPGLPYPAVHPLMEMLPFHRERIFRPHPFEMDQRRLPLAEKQVLQGREGEEVVFGEGHSFSCSVTPAGSPSRLMLIA